MLLKLIAFIFLVQALAENCTTPNNEEGNCIPLSSCSVLYDALQRKQENIEAYIDKSVCGGSKYIPLVCCGSSTEFNTSNRLGSSKTRNLLPTKRICGFQHSDDYYRLGDDTSVRINEFPWLARLIHVWNSSGSETFLDCAGSLINTRYVLTSGFCVDEALFSVVGVRLGEYHFGNETDCVEEPPYEEECSDYKDFAIEQIIRHPNYSTDVNDVDDVALIRLNESVTYTDYIRPICLPSPDAVDIQIGDTVVTSGWKTYDAKRYHKKRIISNLITREECIKNLISRNYPIVANNLTNDSMCTVQKNSTSKEGCNSDIGGPVMISINFQWYQIGIVYFGINCLSTDRAEIHTNLENHVEWIKENLEP